MTRSGRVVVALMVGVGMAVAGAARAAGGAPTVEEAATATYRGIGDVPDAVALKDGLWEGAPFAPDGASRPRVELVRGFHLVGDVGGDGSEDAVVLLTQSSGGSGTALYLAVLGRRDGNVDTLGTAPVGDRVQLRSARLDEGRIVLEVVQAGPDDARCCPGEKATRTFALRAGGMFAEVGSKVTGRLSFADLGGAEWVLRRFSWEDAAPAKPEVTLVVEGERWAGSSGCNRYTTTAKGAPCRAT